MTTFKEQKRVDPKSADYKLLKDEQKKDKIKSFLMKSLWEMMNHFRITEYAVGGSAAGLFYGIDFGRVPSDIDIIVKRGTLYRFLESYENDPFIKIERGSYGADSFCFSIISSDVKIDLIESRTEVVEVNMISDVPVSSIKTLYEAKKTYDRQKDVEDLAILEKLLAN